MQMEITRRQLRRIIREAMNPVRVKSVRPENYNPPRWSERTGPRTSELPQKQIGNFFMSKASDGMPKKGYGALKSMKNFYMILPDGEAIRINGFEGDPSKSIRSVKDGLRYLEALDAGVEILPISDVHNPSEQDIINMNLMQNKIISVARQFKV